LSVPRVLNVKRLGHKVPAGAVYIGRAIPWLGLPESKWHNPFKLRRNANRESRAEVIVRYERHLHHSGLIAQIHELRGYDLVCWCAPEPCHGDVLLRLANEPGRATKDGEQT